MAKPAKPTKKRGFNAAAAAGQISDLPNTPVGVGGGQTPPPPTQAPAPANTGSARTVVQVNQAPAAAPAGTPPPPRTPRTRRTPTPRTPPTPIITGVTVSATKWDKFWKWFTWRRVVMAVIWAILLGLIAALGKPVYEKISNWARGTHANDSVPGATAIPAASSSIVNPQGTTMPSILPPVIILTNVGEVIRQGMESVVKMSAHSTGVIPSISGYSEAPVINLNITNSFNGTNCKLEFNYRSGNGNGSWNGNTDYENDKSSHPQPTVVPIVPDKGQPTRTWQGSTAPQGEPMPDPMVDFPQGQPVGQVAPQPVYVSEPYYSSGGYYSPGCSIGVGIGWGWSGDRYHNRSYQVDHCQTYVRQPTYVPQRQAPAYRPPPSCNNSGGQRGGNQGSYGGNGGRQGSGGGRR